MNYFILALSEVVCDAMYRMKILERALSQKYAMQEMWAKIELVDRIWILWLLINVTSFIELRK